MASSSSFVSSSQYYCPQWKYDVFLSFRGEDTRKTFTGHLYQGLRYKGIFTFQDDKRLEHGDSIPEELLKAIKGSQVALIVFSKNYATSSWCLNELVKIMECKDENGQTVIPVFYDLDPSTIRYQRESFVEAFAKHESKYKDDVEGMQRVQRWRAALTEAANLKGYDIRQGNESLSIQQIVDQISSKLGKTSLSYLQDVVGINTHLENVKSLLKIGINDVRIVGIWGMGGIGKTTIARAIVDTLSYQFEAACFIVDIKENKSGMHSLQNILLSELLREKAKYVNNKEDGKHMIARRLRFKKVLVVLDDIDHIDHLDYLAGNLNWYGDGSRIIVTTRDRHLIGKNDVVYEVTTLVDHQAIQLFNQHAFKEEVPDKSFEKLTLEVVSHANGLPLALKVWGSFLHKRDITEWRSAIEQMEINSKSEIIEKLKISYDRLEPTQQDIFLDIACFLRGKEKDYIMQILESCYSGANIGLSVLIDKSLVFISDYDTIQMHDLIQDMGKYIVKMQKDPGERSRLWDVEDFEEVMVNNTGTKTMEGIWLQHIQKLCFSTEAMKNMKRLRILYIGNFRTHDDTIEYLPNNLRLFACHEYPWESLPESFEPKRLVQLDLRWSLLRHLWTGIKHHFPSLRKLNLSFSIRLMRTPDFTGMPNLEYLNLEGCSNLEEVHHSLGCSRKLIELNLYYCGHLKRFPCVNAESLESLYLDGCSSLEKFPEIHGRTKGELDSKIFDSEIRELPSSIQYLTHTTKLNLRDMENLVALPSSIGMLKSLVELYMSNCSKLEVLPEEIGDLENLEMLDAHNTLISRPPSSIVHLNKLKLLNFGEEIDEERFGEENGCSNHFKDKVYFMFPQVAEGLHSLKILNLSYCNLIDGGLPEDIGCLSSLKELYLRGNNFEHLPRSIAQLSALRLLDTSNCTRLKELPGFMGMPNLETLNLSNCMNLEKVHHSLGFLKRLCTLELTNCKCLKSFPALCIDSLEYLDLKGCSSLENFPEILGSMNLELQKGIRYLDLRGLENLVTLPSSICKLKSLVSLDVSYCSKLESLPEEIGGLENLENLDATCTLISRPPSSIVILNKLNFLSLAKQISEVGLEDGVHFAFPQVNEGLVSLEHLDLSYCNLIDGGLPEDIGFLCSLEVLNLSGNNFEHLPRSIAQLGALRFLHLSYCEKLKKLPDFMGMPNLETLNLSYCRKLEEVHHSMGFFKKLCTLELTNCKQLKRFPALFIDSLEYLDLKGCSSLENFPEILGSMKVEIEIHMLDSVIRNLGFIGFENLVTLPRSICRLRSLVSLDVSDCSKLVSLPEEIGDLEELERLDARDTLISQPPSSIVRLNKLKFLNFAKQKSGRGLVDGVYFIFPQVSEGLRSLEILNLSYCNLTDGGLPEDIGCLSSLKELYLNGNNFEHLPQSIARLGALRSLDLKECRGLTQLPELPPELDALHADCHMALKSIHNLVTKNKKLLRVIYTPLYDKDGAYNDSVYNSFAHALFQNICSLQHDISASDSLSLRVFTIVHPRKKIPSWFQYQGMDKSVSVNLPENWYVSDNFLGFAVCYSGFLIETKAYLIPLCNQMSWMTQNLSLSNHSKSDTESTIHFFLVPLASLWDTSKANGKTPNDYRIIGLTFSGEIKKFGFHLLYKDELEALLQMRENNDEHCTGTRRSRYDSSEHHDSGTNESSCSSSKKQRSQTLQLFPTSPRF